MSKPVQVVADQVAEDERPEIAIPEQPGAPFGQWSTDVPGVAFNFRVEGQWRGQESLQAEARRLEAYLAELDEHPRGPIPFFPFLAPHDGLIHYLTPHGARHIVAVCHGREMSGNIAPRSSSVRLVGVRPDMIDPRRYH